MADVLLTELLEAGLEHASDELWHEAFETPLGSLARITALSGRRRFRLTRGLCWTAPESKG